jgi:hypothetical protein
LSEVGIGGAGVDRLRRWLLLGYAGDHSSGSDRMLIRRSRRPRKGRLCGIEMGIVVEGCELVMVGDSVCGKMLVYILSNDCVSFQSDLVMRATGSASQATPKCGEQAAHGAQETAKEAQV